MTRDDIIRMARDTCVQEPREDLETTAWVFGSEGLESFAALVLANHPPQSSMAWQEGYEAGAAAEREACARMAKAFHQHGYDFTGDLELHDAIRARGQV